MLQAELDEFLGYEKYERSENPNYRNGSYPRKLQTPYGEIEIDMPRDRMSLFDPKIVPKKGNTLTEDLQHKIMIMYSKGLSTRDIVDMLNDFYGVELSPSLISRLTDKIIP
ncbi:MAG: transposase, partial [Hydrogenobaculum sp.]